MILETVTVGAMQVNCYILAEGQQQDALVIDPGSERRKIQKVLDTHRLKPAFIINTHGHFDHIGCDNDFGVPVYIHQKDAAMLKDASLNLSGMFSLSFAVRSKIEVLRDGQNIDLGGLQMEVLHIPGHTPGGIALRLKKPKDNIVFTGDTLFYHGIGRSDFIGGDGQLLVRAIKEKLFTLPGDTVVYPGHGPSSSIDEERKNNPFVA